MITAILCHYWTQPAQIAAVAHVLAATLRRHDQLCTTDFADVERLPPGLTGAPGDEWLPADALLDFIAQNPGAPCALRALRVLFLLLFQFDSRVRRLVLVDHPGLALWRTRPPPRRRAERFVTASVKNSNLRESCLTFMSRIQAMAAAPGPVSYDAVMDAFVAENTTRWCFGLVLPAPPG